MEVPAAVFAKGCRLKLLLDFGSLVSSCPSAPSVMTFIDEEAPALIIIART